MFNRLHCFQTVMEQEKTATYPYTSKYYLVNMTLCCDGLSRTQCPSLCSTSPVVQKKLATLWKVSSQTRRGRTFRDPVKNLIPWDLDFQNLSRTKCWKSDILWKTTLCSLELKWILAKLSQFDCIIAIFSNVNMFFL